MQSIIQYRGFRTAVEAQLERDREKLRNEALLDPAREEKQDEPSPNTSTSTGDEGKIDDRDSDLEKGVANRDYAAQQPSSGVGAGDIPPQGNDNLRREDSQKVQENQVSPGRQEEIEETKTREEEDLEEDDEADDFELGLNSRPTLSRISTTQSAATKLGAVLSGIEVRRRTTREGGDGNVFVVGYEGPDDPQDPHNWSVSRRVRCTLTIAAIGCVVGFASAIDSAALPQAAKDFGVSEVVESLATGLFLVGFGLGALFAGPFSETVGRNPVYIVTLAIYMVFIVASAVAPNIGSQLAFRFIAGFFGSTPLTCAGGSISDLWNPMERVITFPIFANAAFTGPLLGPVMGGFIAQSNAVSWRWVEWTTLIFSAVVLVIVILFQPETFPPILLKWKAQHLREITGDDRYRGAVEVRRETLWIRLKRALYRPFLLTAREPIVMLVALYLTVIYIVLFTFLDGYTYIFRDMYGVSQGLTGLSFLGIIIGLFGASALVPLIYKWAKRDLQKIKEKGGSRLPPEFRLWYSMLGGSLAIPISLFWMGWTARPDISIWSPLIASVFFGYGILCVFITCYTYIIDSYETYAASALASITLIRYVVSGGMVVVGIPFYENLGVAYTLTIMACLSCLLVPVPYVFYKYGWWIRSKSKYAISAE